MLTDGPKTREGHEQLLAFGNCCERQRPDGTWECIDIFEMRVRPDPREIVARAMQPIISDLRKAKGSIRC